MNQLGGCVMTIKILWNRALFVSAGPSMFPMTG